MGHNKKYTRKTGLISSFKTALNDLMAALQFTNMNSLRFHFTKCDNTCNYKCYVPYLNINIKQKKPITLTHLKISYLAKFHKHP